ncbi:hypothetical protein AVEN_225928-1 [Araneus ventricosus]|uniref:Uncharacterized protein n=1 Tax=Araneus ventricosus TaxID=182803 RepID=A0A4Y2BB50_ARAVE|nr:hypothetical protein AVEN_225928-1 [Araneus ventricosus]
MFGFSDGKMSYVPKMKNLHYSLASTSQMRTRLPATATICDRYNVSDRSAAAIASAVLKDFAIICEVDTSHVVDKNKARDRLKDLNFSSIAMKNCILQEMI